MATTTLPAKRTGKTGSSVFLKILMAVTGTIFVLFVLAHMYGNLKLFEGHDAYNEYAEGLRTLGTPELPRHGLLTIAEVVLGVSVLVHIYCAITLWKRSSDARPQRYAVHKRVQQSFSSRWMRWGGVALLLFIIWHLLQFSLLKINVGAGGQAPNITGAHAPAPRRLECITDTWVCQFSGSPAAVEDRWTHDQFDRCRRFHPAPPVHPVRRYQVRAADV